MSIKKQIKSLISKIQNLITNPNSYVAAIVGTLAGLFTGGAIGLFSGGFIGYSYKICSGCMAPVFEVNPDIIIGGVIGLVIGATTGGIITGVVTIIKIHKKTLQLQSLGPEHMSSVLFSAFWISVEICIGMGLGTIIGSLKLPGVGSVLGAFIGTALMLFTSTLEKSNAK